MSLGVFGSVFRSARTDHQICCTRLRRHRIFDAAKRREDAFEVVGRGSKTAWLIGLAVATVIVVYFGMLSLFGIFCTVGIIVYHVDQKPKLIDAATPRW